MPETENGAAAPVQDDPGAVAAPGYRMDDPTVDRTLMLAQIGELTMRNATLATHLEAKVVECARLTEENEELRATLATMAPKNRTERRAKPARRRSA